MPHMSQWPAMPQCPTYPIAPMPPMPQGRKTPDPATLCRCLQPRPRTGHAEGAEAEAACRARGAPRPLVPIGAARGHVLEHVATLARPRAAGAAPPVVRPRGHLDGELELLAVHPVAGQRHGQRAAARARRALRARSARTAAVAWPCAPPRPRRADAIGDGGGAGVRRPRAWQGGVAPRARNGALRTGEEAEAARRAGGEARCWREMAPSARQAERGLAAGGGGAVGAAEALLVGLVPTLARQARSVEEEGTQRRRRRWRAARRGWDRWWQRRRRTRVPVGRRRRRRHRRQRRRRRRRQGRWHCRRRRREQARAAVGAVGAAVTGVVA